MIYDEETLVAWKQAAHVRTTGSCKVCVTPCFLFAASIVSDGVGVADGRLYNGESATSERKIDLATTTGNRGKDKFNPPVFFSKGLYVYHGSNVTSIDVQYIPISE